MPDEPEQLYEETSDVAVVQGWRFDLAMRLGLTPEEAQAVAGDEALDLHTLEQLIARGCPHALALKIAS